MGFDTTLAIMTAALAIGLLSVWKVRRKRKPGPPSWVPWHGLLFVSLLALIACGAHLPSVWP